MHMLFQNPEIIFDHFFRIFNLDIFWVLILQKGKRSRYLVPVTPTTVLSRSFWNFTGALRMVWRHACGFFRILKLFFITGFLLQYLGKWYRTNGPLVNLPILNTSNKNKAGDINSLWNLLVIFLYWILIYQNQIYWYSLVKLRICVKHTLKYIHTLVYWYVYVIIDLGYPWLIILNQTCT